MKTDRIDVENILHTLIAWCRGERHVCSMVVIPSVEEEDLRRTHRERLGVANIDTDDRQTQCSQLTRDNI